MVGTTNEKISRSESVVDGATATLCGILYLLWYEHASLELALVVRRPALIKPQSWPGLLKVEIPQ